MRRAHILRRRLIPKRNLSADAKIAYLDLVLLIYQDIRRLDIPVDDKLLVDENHALNYRL